jgi:Fuc2NAc and GlcNAc transferase
MGDVGSTFTAFMILFLGLLTIRLGWLSYYTWFILGACFITDTTYTLIYRLITRQKWWTPHRIHAYQQTAKRLGHAATVLYILAINVMWLLPLAALSVWYSKFSMLYVVLAYLPLILLVDQLHAGRPEFTPSLTTHPKP